MKKKTYRFGLLEILLVIFVVLKLCNLIDWSWWWVLSPLWIPILLYMTVALISALKDRGE